MADFEISEGSDSALVVCSIRGLVDLDEALRIGGAARRAASERNANLLYDLRQAEVTLSAAEFFDLARQIDIAGIPRVERVSVLAPKRPSNLDFYETTAFNAGHVVRVFDDEDAAYAFAAGEGMGE